MPKTEDGEFELILGNRQLLSVFFIVVVLLGVFFTMGYIVGRNSGPGAEARKAEPKQIVVDSAAQSQSPVGEAVKPAPDSTIPAAPPADQTQSAQTQPAPSPVTPSPEPKAETPPRAAEKKTAEPPRAAATKPEPASNTPGDPQPGALYLQIAAVARTEAELVVDVLAKKGFHAIYAQIPEKPTVFRVLVGPFRDSSSVAQARTDLNKAGFNGFEAIQRKF